YVVLFFQAEDGIRDRNVTGVQTCALPISRWLTALQQTFPKVHIDVAADNSSAVIHAVRQGDLDLGFIETPYVPVGLNTAVIQDDELIVATAPWHPWAHSQRAISLEELAETPLVVREQGSGT